MSTSESTDEMRAPPGGDAASPLYDRATVLDDIAALCARASADPAIPRLAVPVPTPDGWYSMRELCPMLGLGDDVSDAELAAIECIARLLPGWDERWVREDA